MKKRDAKRQAILDTAYRLFLTQGFDRTSVSQITAEVGGSKATIYSHFPSKEELFVECVTAAAEDFIDWIAGQALIPADSAAVNPDVMLREYGTRYLTFVCTPDMIAVKRLLIAEAARSQVGKLFYAKQCELRGYVETFLAGFMAAGALREDDPRLAAEYLRGLLEADIVDPLLLQAREDYPDASEIAGKVDHAIAVFLRAYG